MNSTVLTSFPGMVRPCKAIYLHVHFILPGCEVGRGLDVSCDVNTVVIGDQSNKSVSEKSWLT